MISRRWFAMLLGLMLLVPSAAFAQRRVLFISLDGLGYKNLTDNGPGQELTTLHKLAKRGVLANLQTSFPSKTSPGHAALFTGAWAGANGIYANTNPRIPRSQHALRDTVSGFRSETLTAEPLWTAAARQGLKAVAYQATQLYPFTDRSVGKAVALNGYQSRTLAPMRVATHKDIGPDGSWTDGPLTFRIKRLNDGLKISLGASAVVVKAISTETASPRKRPLARYFSEPLWVEADGIRTGVYFRLFEYDKNNFLLYRSAAQELASSDLNFDLQQQTGPFVANSATSIYEKGSLGKILSEGGDGTAERRYLETTELVIRQLTRQTVALNQTLHPALLVGYYPVIDDIEHAWFGFASTGDLAVNQYRSWGYAALDEGLKQVLKGFSKQDSVVFASDHGMSGATHEVRMPALLRELGFSLDEIIPNVTCVFINSVDWKQGVVAQNDRAALLSRLEGKLSTTGLFTRFFQYQEMEQRFGLFGASAPDLCFDLKLLHYPTETDRTPALFQYPHPRGEHGFNPTRVDMQSYLIVSGAGTTRRNSPCFNCYRAIDVAPTISVLLGIQPPAQATGTPIHEVKRQSER